MARDTKREPEGTGSAPQPERPVAEREPLTITVIEPAAAPDRTAPAPPGTIIREPVPARRIPLPRWYWVLVGIAAAMVFIDYRYVWEPRIEKFMEHRVLPPRVVRIENSLWRHTFGRPKHAEPHSGLGRVPDAPLAALPPPPFSVELDRATHPMLDGVA